MNEQLAHLMDLLSQQQRIKLLRRHLNQMDEDRLVFDYHGLARQIDALDEQIAQQIRAETLRLALGVHEESQNVR